MDLRAENQSMDKQELVAKETLIKLHPLSELLPDDIDDLAKNIYIEYLPAGSVLFQQGATDPLAIYLLSGTVELHDRTGQQSRIIGCEALARRALSQQKPRNATATAVTDVAIIRIDGKLLELMLNTCSLAQSTRPATLNADVIEDRLFSRLYQDYLDDQLAVPSMPDIALRVRRAIDDSNKNVDDIAKIVQADPGLTARLVQVANTSLYRGTTPILGCRQAITRLGLQQTRNLVFSFALKQLFRADSAPLRKRMIGMWQHTASVAAIAAILAKLTPGFEIDRGLLAGLVHDIGVLPILSYAERYPQLIANPAVFDDLLSRLRGQIGALVLRKWEFDEDLVTVALEAENWERDAGPEVDYADLIIIAQLHSYIGTPRMATLPAIDQVPAFTKLALGKLSPRMSVQILEESRDDITEVEKLLLG